MNNGPTQTVVVQAAPTTPSAAAAGLGLAILGFLSCGLMSIPAFFLCALSLIFDRGRPKAVGAIGLVLSLPGVLIFAFFGFGFFAAMLGISAATKAVNEAHQTVMKEMEKKAQEQKQAEVEWKEPERTYPSIEMPSIAVVRVERPDQGNPPEPEPPTFREGYSVRTWKDKSGKYSTVGEMKSFSNWEVIIMKTDGTEAKVPRDKLSDEDLEYLKDGWKTDKKMIKERK